jgi:hypothetical protein
MINCGTGTLHWTVAKDAAWLVVSPAGGNGEGTVRVSIDVSGLADGIYAGVITVSDPNASNSPQRVKAVLMVRTDR